ncbi:hypothetical protein [Flavobacterium sedimenticola]|uniref:DUF3575 domain-containing protein n=1 Tax=Flavobacterium sedimenticola TaxID=3043286 RepID=A0ABT6XS53_9FLAO|nr:hypothetical protein [Flavobacterium sedimenticola]MDI9257920.1 hypothetical protein [Flavobacterium sedimenticola]
MQKRILWIGLAIVLANSLQVNAQYDNQDLSNKRWFVGSTLFLLGNFDEVNPPGFVQLNLGYRITGKDVISLELITWKHAWPLGINPFYNDAYGEPQEKFPGYIREYGIGLAYQRFFWKGLYAASHVMPMWQTYKNENGDMVGNGFIIFNTYRIGYHFKLFRHKFFIEPSIGIAGRPYYTEMPDGFKEKDDKWPKWTPEPGLHFGFNF